MTVQFRLPDLGEGITEAEIVRWLVKPGEVVVQDQEIVAVQSDKAIVELPAPTAGTILELYVSEGQVVPVKTVLFSLQEYALHGDVALVAGDSLLMDHGDVGGRARILATPVARRMARELGIDIATIQGTGPAGRIRTDDVQKFISTQQGDQVARRQLHCSPQTGEQNGATATLPDAASTSSASISTGDEERIPLHGLRRRIAENMLLSVQTIPQVTAQIEVDVSELVVFRQKMAVEADAQGSKFSYLPYIIKALIQALRLYPYVNATIDDRRKEIVLKHRYHIGIATATPEGLLVPVLRHADRLNVLELATEVPRLVEAARAHKLPPDELRGSTFTISNYGSIGGFFTTPLINPGEAGILGLGRITRRPWVVDDHLEVRSVLPLSFSADHRLIDGELAMSFLNTLIALLESPQRLLLYLR